MRRDVALRRAVANCRRALLGEAPLHLVVPDEPMCDPCARGKRAAEGVP